MNQPTATDLATSARPASPSSAVLICRLVHEPQRLYRFARWVLFLAAVIASLNTLRLAVDSLGPAHVHRKDFLQEYLLGRAVLAGTNPYLPLPELAERYLGPLPDPVFPHPTPHPPPVALLGLLVAPFAYPVAAGIWLLMELVCIGIAVWLLLRHLGGNPSALTICLLLIAVIATDAGFYELIMGQLQSLVLLLVLLSWFALEARRDWAGGILLGAALALKMMGWPLVLFLLLQRRWRAVLAAGAAFCALSALAALAMGAAPLARYYLHVASLVSRLYRSDPFNIALSSIGWRLFEGTASMVQVSLTAPPLIRWQPGAFVVAVAIPALFLLLSVWAATRARSSTGAFVLLCCASALVNPIAWTHYALLAIPAVIWLWRRLYVLGFPRLQTYGALAATLGLYVRSPQLHALAVRLSGQAAVAGRSVTVPFAASLITLLPTLVLLGITYLVWRVDRLRLQR